MEKRFKNQIHGKINRLYICYTGIYYTFLLVGAKLYTKVSYIVSDNAPVVVKWTCHNLWLPWIHCMVVRWTLSGYLGSLANKAVGRVVVMTGKVRVCVFKSSRAPEHTNR